MQASLEAEVRGKVEAMRSKKKLEHDINELEVALDAANRGRADTDKNIKKLQQQMRELQQQVIDGIRGEQASYQMRYYYSILYSLSHEHDQRQTSQLQMRYFIILYSLFHEHSHHLDLVFTLVRVS